MSFFKGWLGEMKAAFNMWLSLDQRIYKSFHNSIIPASNGTTQIDHILVSQYGIFIVETKNKSGWIFGSKDSAQWTQVLYGKKYPFQNPLRQTYRQKKILSEFLSVDESSIHTVVYFAGKSKFKTEMPSNVISSGLGRFIKEYQDHFFTEDDVHRIVDKLDRHNSESKVTASDHVRSLQERHNSSTICPNCGASLKLKTSKKGPSAGVKFLGCETYPRCKFTRAA